MKSRKLIVMVLFLLSGCVTRSAVMQDTVIEERDAHFFLKDGTIVRSYAGDYQRVLDGYEVAGTVTIEGREKKFSGFLADSTIEMIKVDHFNVTATVAFIVVAVGAVIAVLSAIDFTIM